MRVFVALEVPSGVADRIDAAVAPVRERYPELNWTTPASWHVTLAFVGEVEEAGRDAVAEAVSEAVDGSRVGEVELSLAPPGRFGRGVAWLGVRDDPAGAVADLGEAIQGGLEAAGLPVDRKELRPHLTLVRARGRGGRLPRRLVDELPRVEASWRVSQAGLYRSHLGRPVRYERLWSTPL